MKLLLSITTFLICSCGAPPIDRWSYTESSECVIEGTMQVCPVVFKDGSPGYILRSWERNEQDVCKESKMY